LIVGFVNGFALEAITVQAWITSATDIQRRTERLPL